MILKNWLKSFFTESYKDAIMKATMLELTSLKTSIKNLFGLLDGYKELVANASMQTQELTKQTVLLTKLISLMAPHVPYEILKEAKVIIDDSNDKSEFKTLIKPLEQEFKQRNDKKDENNESKDLN